MINMMNINITNMIKNIINKFIKLNGVIKNILGYVLNTKWYYYVFIIIINLLSYIYKFSLYKQLTGSITGITENFVSDDNINNINNVFIIYLIKLSILHLVQYITIFILEKQVTTSVRAIFDTLINRIIHYDVQFFKQNSNGQLSQIWFYLNNVEYLFKKIVISIPRILTFSLYYIYMIYTFSSTAFFIIIPINLLSIYFLHSFSKKQYSYQQNKIKLDSNMKNKFLEVISNIATIKLNNKQDDEINKIISYYEEHDNIKYVENKLLYTQSTISDIFNDVLLVIIYSFGLSYIFSGLMMPNEIIYLAIHTGNFYLQITELKEIYDYYRKNYNKLRVINDLLHYEHFEDIYAKNNNSNILKRNNDIIFYNVSFSYDGHQQILKDINFSFENNKINLLLGPNGSGKSTIVRLLLRLYELESNNSNNLGNIIYYKGRNIKNMSLKELREKIGFVGRDPSLFNDTVINNIKYGNDNIDYDKILQICGILGCKQWFVDNQNKQVGFRGKNLSGGEKKKIQLLNAICKNPEIIIFDEPSNTLDKTAIKWFMKFIIKLKHFYKKTIIIITHDLRLKKVANKIIDLNNLK